MILPISLIPIKCYSICLYCIRFKICMINTCNVKLYIIILNYYIVLIILGKVYNKSNVNIGYKL